MSEKGRAEAIFTRRLHEKYLARQRQLQKCLYDLTESTGHSSKKSDGKGNENERKCRKIDESMQKYMTKIRIGTQMSEEFQVNAGVHQGCALSPTLLPLGLMLVC